MKIHFIGAGGASMSVLESISARLGEDVSGSDIKTGGHDKKNISGKDLVVYSGAIPENNEELSYARKLGVPVMERSEFLAFISSKYRRVIAVAGCHGKTTTTAMLGEVLAKKNPTVHIGGEYDFGFTQKNDYFITEACEYRRSFLQLKPDVAIITNIDFDHPDTYRDISDTEQAFCEFTRGCKAVIYNGDDVRLKKIVPLGVSVGFSSDNDYVIRTYSGCFDLFYRDSYSGSFSPVFSEPFNIKNAALAIVAAYRENLCYRDIKEGIERFTGVKRRGEIVSKDAICTVISDYSHHPAEIKERISALKKQYGKVAVIFQPHTYSRTIALADRFAAAFSEADEVVFTDTFAAREKSGDDRLIYDICRKNVACSFVPKNLLREKFLLLKQDYPCVALMGAGDFQAELLEKYDKKVADSDKTDKNDARSKKSGEKS